MADLSVYKQVGEATGSSRNGQFFEPTRDYLSPGSLFVRLVLYPNNSATNPVKKPLDEKPTNLGESVGVLTGLVSALVNSPNALFSASNPSGADTSSDVPIVLNLMPDYLENLSYNGVSDKIGVIKLVLFDASFSFLETLLLSRKSVNVFFGWLTRDGKVAQSKEVRGFMNSYKPTFTYQGSRIEVEYTSTEVVTDSGVSTSTWNDDIKNKLELPAQTILPNVKTAYTYVYPHIVVETIAKELGLKADVVETKKVDASAVYRPNVSAIKYIRDILCPLTVSANGETPFALVVKNGKLVFKPASVISKENIKRYVYGRDTGGTMLDFRLQVEENKVWDGAFGSISGVGFDPIDKKLITVNYDNSDPTKKLKDRPSFANYTPETAHLKNATAGRVYVTPYYTSSSLTAATKSIQASLMSLQTFTAEAMLVGDVTIEVFDLLSVVVLAGNTGQLHYSSGIYMVLEVEHTLSQNGFTTRVKMVTDGTFQKVPNQEFNNIQETITREFSSLTPNVFTKEVSPLPSK